MSEIRSLETTIECKLRKMFGGFYTILFGLLQVKIELIKVWL